MTTHPQPSNLVSIIIEWDNARLSAASRAISMLEALRHQASEAAFDAEFLVLFDDEQINADDLRDLIHQHLVAGALSQARCELVPAGQTRYYDLKNKGAQMAKGEIIVFVDSDVLLEANWLNELTAPLRSDPQVHVVAGETYMSTNSLMEKAFALHWFFPLRTTPAKAKHPAQFFFANNVAFRRVSFLAQPFPTIPDGMTRGACNRLAAQLLQSGEVIWATPAAKTSHPAPNGLHHFFERALAQGRDWALNEKDLHGQAASTLVFTAIRKLFLSKLNRILKGTLREGRRVSLSWWQSPAVIAIMWTYTLFVMIGAITAAVLPSQARRIWQL